MRQVRLTFTDKEFNNLKREKTNSGYQSWELFIFARCSEGKTPRHKKIRSVK
jgi:hypothetical protein